MVQHRMFWYIFIIAIVQFQCIFTFNLEEIKWLNYEVNILQVPVKREEEPKHPVVYVVSKYGQEYQCLLPQITDDESIEKESSNVKHADIKDLLAPLQSGVCLTKSKDWWTYELCFGHHIKQFHIEEGKIVGQVITLGEYESDYDWNNQTNQDKFKHVKQKYHTQYYNNGSKCDLTGQPRTTEVRLYCEEESGDYIHRVDEPGTCSYIFTVYTSRVCSHPQLKSIPPNKVNSIPCSPLLNEEQYAKYLLKVNEEKSAAEEKRTQWLTDQQERLKLMKEWAKENVIHVESEDMTNPEENSEKPNDDPPKSDNTAGNAEVPKDIPPKKINAEDKETDNPGANQFQFPGDSAMNDAIDDKLLENMEKDDDELEKEFEILTHEYEHEIETLKRYVPSADFGSLKFELIKYFEKVLNNVKDRIESDDEIPEHDKQLTFAKLESTLAMFLKKLNQAEQEVMAASEQKEAQSEIIMANEEVKHQVPTDSKINTNENTKAEEEQIHPISTDSKTNTNENPKEEIKGKAVESKNGKANTNVIEDNSQSLELDDDKLHVRIRRLNRNSPDSSGQLHEMDFVQRKKLEEAVKEKLEKAGLDTGGRRVEVKIITAGYYDNEEGKDFHMLSDDETNQFQNMIMALLTGQQEAVQEMERQKKLEENYKFTWDEEEEEEKKNQE